MSESQVIRKNMRIAISQITEKHGHSCSRARAHERTQKCTRAVVEVRLFISHVLSYLSFPISPWSSSSSSSSTERSRTSSLAIVVVVVITIALWSRTAKNIDWNTGPLACLVARSLAPLTCTAHSFACLHTSLFPKLMGQWMITWLLCVFFYFGP